MEPPSIVVVTRGVILAGVELLMVERAADDRWKPGHIEFPGGKVDPAWTIVSEEDKKDLLKATLRREVGEEIALNVKIRRAFHVGSRIMEEGPADYLGKIYIVIFYAAWLKDLNAKPRLGKEHASFRLVTEEEFFEPALITRMTPGTFEAGKRFFELH